MRTVTSPLTAFTATPSAVTTWATTLYTRSADASASPSAPVGV